MHTYIVRQQREPEAYMNMTKLYYHTSPTPASYPSAKCLSICLM